MGTGATLVLTAALVLITAWYAKSTKGMLHEMKRTRESEAEPKIVLDLHGVGPNTVFPTLVNVGAGPALNVAVELTFIDHQGAPIERRNWRTELLIPGDRRRFFPPDDEGGFVADIDSLTERVARIHIKGKVVDRIGQLHPVDYEITNLAEWSKLLTSAKEEFLVPTDERAAVELKKLRERLDKLLTLLNRGLHVRSDDDLKREAAEHKRLVETRRARRLQAGSDASSEPPDHQAGSTDASPEPPDHQAGSTDASPEPPDQQRAREG